MEGKRLGKRKRWEEEKKGRNFKWSQPKLKSLVSITGNLWSFDSLKRPKQLLAVENTLSVSPV